MSQSINYSRWNVAYGLPNPASVSEVETNSTTQCAALEANSSFAIQEVNSTL
jgi:hypothetical protein